MTEAITTETRRSRCDVCRGPISISITIGEQRWDDVDWQHSDLEPPQHRAVPEMRICIDEDCPGCGFPEIGFAPASEQFICSRCGFTSSTRRPSEDIDPTPCCPDPDCSGNPCTFSGYSPNH